MKKATREQQQQWNSTPNQTQHLDQHETASSQTPNISLLLRKNHRKKSHCAVKVLLGSVILPETILKRSPLLLCRVLHETLRVSPEVQT